MKSLGKLLKDGKTSCLNDCFFTRAIIDVQVLYLRFHFKLTALVHYINLGYFLSCSNALLRVFSKKVLKVLNYCKETARKQPAVNPLLYRLQSWVGEPD